MGAMLLFVGGSIATPGIARDAARQPDAPSSISFADTFAPYAATPPAPQVASGAVDIGALPPAQTDASGPDGQAIGDGLASWYGAELAGHRTAGGERFDPSDLTAAHRSLPLGSHVRVTDERTGRSVVVRINDRGPWARGRVIDLSEAAARQLGIMGTGEARVSLALLTD
mgnify:CR=1 FL=1